MNVIEARNISMSYEGKKVVENVSFDVKKGECFLIAGENGSGKTTLLKALTSLKRIDSGSLSFKNGLKQNEIGYLPQQTEVQKDFPASVREVVLSGCINKLGLLPFYTKKQKLIADMAMDKLELTPISKKCYHELSGGQQQRVLLARAICASQKILILDEPTTALDMTAAREFYSFTAHLKAEGMTIVMISHDIKNALEYADTVLHLGDLKPLFYGSCEDYKHFINKGGESI